MLYEVELVRHVAVPAENRLVFQRSIVNKLLEDLVHERVNKDLGYFVAVTRVKRIGKGDVRKELGKVSFPVVFTSRIFMPMVGEILEGVVHMVLRLGVLLKCGPMEHVFLSYQKMPNYSYFCGGEEQFFVSNKLEKIGKDVVVRFKVLNLRWIERREEIQREFQMLASLEGDSLGPVSMPGDDESDL